MERDYNWLAIAYGEVADKVPGATHARTEYLAQYHQIYDDAVSKRRAENREELGTKVGIG
ncbi:hypothetical protein PWY87_24260 [Kribbella solani]|uniref:hypothetical protein n=1 Tax=Kribbella solani TaxID=236067 RepID=UPI0029BE68C2|nr:hypothetical protein [Kribbella solani]MDX3004819.1 hypothetical protein [Kribbella solani]